MLRPADSTIPSFHEVAATNVRLAISKIIDQIEPVVAHNNLYLSYNIYE